MTSRHSSQAAVLAIVLACSPEPEAGTGAMPVGDRLAFEGTVDAFGPPMAAAGAGGR